MSRPVNVQRTEAYPSVTAAAPGSFDLAAPPESDALARQVREALARGDRESACALYEPLVGRLQRRAGRVAWWHLRDMAEADDAVQEAFVKAFERIGQYRPELPFEAWFFRILVNTCLDRGKARARQHRWLAWGGDEGHDEVASAEPSPEHRLLRDERARQLAAALASLPGRQRMVVLLSQLEGRASAEIGEMIGVSESTVRVHLFRGMRKLRERLAATFAQGLAR